MAVLDNVRFRFRTPSGWEGKVVLLQGEGLCEDSRPLSTVRNDSVTEGRGLRRLPGDC